MIYRLQNGSFLSIPDNINAYLIRVRDLDPKTATTDDVIDAFTFAASLDFNYDRDSAAYKFVIAPLRKILTEFNFSTLSISELAIILCSLAQMEWPRYDERLRSIRATITHKFNARYFVDNRPVPTLRALHYVGAKDLRIEKLTSLCSSVLESLIDNNVYTFFPSILIDLIQLYFNRQINEAIPDTILELIQNALEGFSRSQPAAEDLESVIDTILRISNDVTNIGSSLIISHTFINGSAHLQDSSSLRIMFLENIRPIIFYIIREIKSKKELALVNELIDQLKILAHSELMDMKIFNTLFESLSDFNPKAIDAYWDLHLIHEVMANRLCVNSIISNKLRSILLLDIIETSMLTVKSKFPFCVYSMHADNSQLSIRLDRRTSTSVSINISDIQISALGKQNSREILEKRIAEGITRVLRVPELETMNNYAQFRHYRRKNNAQRTYHEANGVPNSKQPKARFLST